MKYLNYFENEENINKKLIKSIKDDDIINVRKLIKLGADVNFTNTKTKVKGSPLAKSMQLIFDDDPPLIIAVENDNLEILDELLKNKNIDLEIKGYFEPDSMSPRDSTALMLSAGWNRPEILKRLIKAGANINSKGHDGMTGLIASTVYGYTECIIILIKSGANMHMTDKFGDDFSEFLDDDIIKIIKKECPKEYSQYLLEKETNKFNI